MQATESDFGGFSSDDFESMSSTQRVEFLAQLLIKVTLKHLQDIITITITFTR